MESTAATGERVDRSPLIAALVAGDALAVSIFVGVGTLHHSQGASGLVTEFVGAVAPFLAGWWAVALLGGLYRTASVASVGRAAILTFGAWVLAVGVALALRSTAFVPGGFAWTFALVAVAVGGALLVTWRSLVALLS